MTKKKLLLVWSLVMVLLVAVTLYGFRPNIVLNGVRMNQISKDGEVVTYAYGSEQITVAPNGRMATDVIVKKGNGETESYYTVKSSDMSVFAYQENQLIGEGWYFRSKSNEEFQVYTSDPLAPAQPYLTPYVESRTAMYPKDQNAPLNAVDLAIITLKPPTQPGVATYMYVVFALAGIALVYILCRKKSDSTV